MIKKSYINTSKAYFSLFARINTSQKIRTKNKKDKKQSRIEIINHTNSSNGKKKGKQHIKDLNRGNKRKWTWGQKEKKISTQEPRKKIAQSVTIQSP